MCNDFGNRVTYREYVEAFERQNLRVIFPPPGGAPNYPPLEEIWPTDSAPMVRAVPGGVAIEPVRWGLTPGRPKGPPVINMRSEGRAFSRGRVLVPASHFFEFTGTKSPKTRWRFTVRGADWFCFAAFMGRGEADGQPVDAFTLLTVAPGPDVARYHDRQPAILAPDQWSAWLDPAHPAGPLLGPAAEGSLVVEESPRPPGEETPAAKRRKA